MQDTVIISALVPVALMLLMLGVGLSLELTEFRRVLKAPKALVAGAFGQLVLLPLLGLVVATSAGLDTKFALGIIVLSSCPGGALSNAICGLVRADVALSVSLTALSSVVTPFSIPLFYSLLAGRVGSSVHPSLDLPLAPTMARLVAVSIVPIVVGMWIRRSFGDSATKVETTARKISVVLFITIIIAVVAENADVLRSGLRSVGVAALLLNVAATASGVALARLARLSRPATVTLGIEIGMQNAATATFVTMTLLQDAAMALPPAIYALVMLPMALGAGLAGRRWMHDA